MILVTVGTHDQGFDRLVKAADELATITEEKVIIQHGVSKYVPLYTEHFRWTTSDEMLILTKEARVVIAHAAAGAIILAFRLNKPLVVVPRLKQYREHVDDHQKQLARALGKSNRLVVVDSPTSNSLMIAIQSARQIQTNPHGNNTLLEALSQTLAFWEHEITTRSIGGG